MKIQEGFVLKTGSTQSAWRLQFHDIKLYVDGVEKAADYVFRYATRVGPGDYELTRMWVFNFPEGLSGSHNFYMEMYLECSTAVQSGLYQGTCPVNGPPSPVLVWTTGGTISFNQ